MPTSRPLVSRWHPLVLQTDAMFRIQHTDPWVRGDAHRTSRTITVQVGMGGLLCVLVYFGLRRSCAWPFLIECCRQHRASLTCPDLHAVWAHMPRPARSLGCCAAICRLLLTCICVPLLPTVAAFAQNDKSSSAPIHGRAQDDVEHADGAAAGCALRAVRCLGCELHCWRPASLPSSCGPQACRVFAAVGLAGSRRPLHSPTECGFLSLIRLGAMLILMLMVQV